MANKTAVIQKTIEGVVYDLMFKTTASNVSLEDGTTVDAKIAEISSKVSNIITENIIDSKISTASSDLYNKIMGISGSDVTINEAYDTIKEISDWLENDANADAAKIISDISTLQTKVEDLETNATIVEASETNGSIKVNNKDVTVYTHPETHSAEMIEETDTKKFVTPEEKEAWNAKSLITIGAETPAEMGENDYFFKEVPGVTVTITCENGTASKSSAELDSGASIFLTFTPSEGHTIEGGSVLVNGEANNSYEVDYTGKVSLMLSNITEETTVAVSFVAVVE